MAHLLKIGTEDFKQYLIAVQVFLNLNFSARCGLGP